MDKEMRIKSQLETEKTLLKDAEESRQTQKNLFTKLDDILQKDLRFQNRISEEKQNYHREIEHEVKHLKDIALDTKPNNYINAENRMKTVLNEAIKEAEHMVKISQEAMNIKPQNYSKQIDDITQTNKTEPTPITKTNSSAEHLAAASQALSEEERFNLKTIKVSEEVGIKQQTSNKNQDKEQTEINNSQIKKAQKEEKLELSMEMNYSNSNQESKGKEIAEEKQKELIEQKKSPVTIFSGKLEAPIHPAKINKLREKFRKSSMHF